MNDHGIGCRKCDYTGFVYDRTGAKIDCQCQYRRKKDPPLSSTAQGIASEAVRLLTEKGKLL